uniref:Uncharacterized protein n=1 Tax=viral metagenome TaxID=1070528 RepID=A0A6C0BLR7_9ZZZZ
MYIGSRMILSLSVTGLSILSIYIANSLRSSHNLLIPPKGSGSSHRDYMIVTILTMII